MKLFIKLLFICFLLSPSAFAQSYIFANSAGSLGYESANAITKDPSGNLYMTGYFSDSVYFGSVKIKSAGVKDIFIVKFDPSGNVIWAKKYGGNYTDEANSIALDNSGNIYITGDLSSDSVSFDTVKVYCSSQQIFIAKFNNTGTCLWAKQIGDETRADDRGAGLDVDANGNVYVTGYYQGTASFGNGISLSSIIHPIYLTPSDDIFVAKFNSNGICQWANSAGSYGTEKGFSVAVDAAGNCYSSGFFTNTTIFSGVSVTCASGGTPDGYVAVYDNSGYLTQLKTIAGTSYEACYGITLDGLGNYYITGLKSGNALFDTINVQSYGSYDMFLAKYSTSGNVKWVRTTQGSQWEEGSCVRCDSNGDPYVAGDFYFNGTTPFPPEPFPGQGGYDAMIAKYNRHGEFQWAQKGGSTGADYCQGIVITDSGKVYACGSYANNATFGNFYLSNSSGGGGWNDLFYIKLRTDINTGTPAGYPFCGGATISIPYVANIAFKPANVFTAQLSDANGRFASAVNIGTLTSTTSGNITAVIPSTIPTGNGYRVRVIASDTSAIGTDNGIDLIINAAPAVSLTVSDSAICTGDSALLSTPYISGCTYKWYFNNVLIGGAVNSTYYAKQTGTYKVRVTNASGCSKTSANRVITVNNYPLAQVTASGPLTFCKGDSVILTAATGAGYVYQWKKGNTILNGANSSTYKATTTGNYKVIVTNGAGCSSTSSQKKVTVITPVAIISSDSVTFCIGDSLKLQANIVAGYSYQWKKGSANVSGGTNPVLYAKTSGTYKVVVTDSNGCTVASNKITVYVVSCRSGFTESGAHIAVSPNPSADGRFSVIADEQVNGIRVVDLLGREIINEKAKQGRFTIDLSDYPDAVYFLQVELTGSMEQFRLIKQ